MNQTLDLGFYWYDIYFNINKDFGMENQSVRIKSMEGLKYFWIVMG